MGLTVQMHQLTAFKENDQPGKLNSELKMPTKFQEQQEDQFQYR